LTEAQFNDSLTSKDHGGAEFGVAAFKILIQPELGLSPSYDATSGQQHRLWRNSGPMSE
jgi:hypothetical protein